MSLTALLGLLALGVGVVAALVAVQRFRALSSRLDSNERFERFARDQLRRAERSKDD